MIVLDANYSLVIKMGELKSTTECDYVLCYGQPWIRRLEGNVTKSDTLEVATGTTNGTTDVTMLAAPTERYEVKSIRITNRDTIAHNIYVSLRTGASTDRRIYSPFELPANETLSIGGSELYLDTDYSLIAKTGEVTSATESDLARKVAIRHYS